MHAGELELWFSTAVSTRSTEAAIDWSARKDVGAAHLNRALHDVLAIEGLRTLPSDSIKVEYLRMRDLSEKGIVFNTPVRPWVNATGYPAQFRDTSRLVVANLLTQADRPRQLRTRTHSGRFRLFELDPAQPPDPRLRPPEQIEAMASNHVVDIGRNLRDFSAKAAQEIEYYDPTFWTGNLWEVPLWHDVTQLERSALLLTLALQRHYREHSEFPATLQDLVSQKSLESIPIDPFGKGEPFRYRREPNGKEAVLWSVWWDGIDQDGADRHGWRGDWTVHVRPPGSEVPSSTSYPSEGYGPPTLR
jgi:hypothetical protein